jgi:hypothetical protein
MTEHTTGTARALLWRHNLPEDVIDGALCLHAQELAAVQREAIRKTDDPVFYEGEAGWLVSLIEPETAAAPAVPAGQAPATDHRLSVQHADALWDAVAIPGPTEPTFTEQHQRVCKAVADILDEMTPAPVLPASVDRADVLEEAADGFDRHAAQLLDGVGDKAVFVAKALRDQAAVWSEAAETLRRLAAPSAVVVRRATDETPSEADRCGLWGGCPLPRGHNMGQADIPENHQPPAVGAQQLVCKCPAEICQCGHHQAQQPKETRP